MAVQCKESLYTIRPVSTRGMMTRAGYDLAGYFSVLYGDCRIGELLPSEEGSHFRPEEAVSALEKQGMDYLIAAQDYFGMLGSRDSGRFAVLLKDKGVSVKLFGSTVPDARTREDAIQQCLRDKERRILPRFSW